MSVQVFENSVVLPKTAAEAFAWLERPGALERLTPPWESLQVVKPAASLADGTQVELLAQVGPISTRWVVEHRDFREGVQFRDVALRSPFKSWTHLHRVEPEGCAEARLIDHIEYELPFGPLGLLGRGFVRRKLERMFRYRHNLLRDDLEMARRYGATRKMRILVAGASGFVGRALVPFLRSQGHEVARLVRRQPGKSGEFQWNPSEGSIDVHALKGVDAVINLAGESIASGRWTEQRKASLVESRLSATRTLVKAIEQAKHRPFVLINASAIGYYGDRNETRLDESAPAGTGFLAELTQRWEKEAFAAEEFGVRVAALRFGMVLSPEGGALAKVLPLFRLGLGGPVGPRHQWTSWITRDDALGLIYHSLLDQRCRGPLNAVAPQPVRQGDFAKTLGRTLARPAVLPAPAWALRVMLGEMAKELLLSSQRVLPTKALSAGYVFRHPTLEEALAHVLGSVPRPRAKTEATPSKPSNRRGQRPRRR